MQIFRSIPFYNKKKLVLFCAKALPQIDRETINKNLMTMMVGWLVGWLTVVSRNRTTTEAHYAKWCGESTSRTWLTFSLCAIE
jgi:hypothetical protein